MKAFFTIILDAIKGKHYTYTGGSIKKAILLLAVPMILELALESVFAVVDTYFVGKLPNSKNAIAVVGLTESVISLIYTLAIGFSIGATALVSRRVGENNLEEAARTSAQVLMTSAVFSLLLSALGFVFAENILQLMGAAPAVVAEGLPFARLMFGSSTVIVYLFVINGIFRGAGNAAMAMYSLWIASAINILLCPVLIYGLGPIPAMGLTGAALATVIGRTVGVLFQLYSLFRAGSSFKIDLSYFNINLEAIKSFLNVAWPATFQFFIQTGSWIFMAYLVSETGSTEASAGYQIAIRCIVFFILPAWGLSNAAATLVGQNLGANQPDRAERSVLICAKINVAFMALVTLIFVFLPEPIARLFTKDVAVISYATLSLQVIGAGFLFYGIGMVMVQALNGAGDSRTPTLINFICFWLVQVPLGYLLAKTFDLGPLGALIAIPSAETLLAIMAFYYFKVGKWKEIKV